MFDRPAMLWLLALAPLAAYPALIAMRRGWYLAGGASALLRLGCLAVLVAMLAGLRITALAAARRLEIVALLDESRSIAPDQLAWMRTRVRAVARAMDARDRLGVIGFGRDARLGAGLSDPRLLGDCRMRPDRGATDIAAGLTAAQSLFSAEADRRVLLLSDGNQTRGSAAAEIPALVDDGTRIYTAAPPPSATARVALTGFHAPQNLRAEQQFSFALEIESEAPGPVDAQLRLLSDDTPVGGQHMTLHPGLNRFELPYRIDRAGAYLMSADLTVAPALEAINPRAEIALSVAGAPRVLIVSASRPESLLEALRVRHYRVAMIAPRALSPHARDYLPYQLVIIDDAPSAALSAPVQHALNRYVAELGGGLVVTGEALRDDHYRGGELEKALPVSFERQPPPPSREPIAVYLCIDRSNSMSYDSRYPAVRDGERIRYAKQAAIALLRQLDDTDYAGVIAFDSQPYVLGRLQPLGEDRADLEARIERLQPGGGTDFKDALEIAHREILASAIPVRQVILLTDGDTNRQYHDHDALIAQFAKDRIPVSTIRIGPDLENLRLLKDFAQATGGVFYRVQDIEKLPLLLVGLTRQAMDRRAQGTAMVQAGAHSAILSGIAARDIPPIDFYASTRAKDGAQVVLSVMREEKNSPLLAAWQYGLGRAAIFAADPDSLATLSWIRWNRYAQFWSQLARWTMREGAPGMFAIRVHTASDGAVTVEALKADASPAPNLICRVTGPGRALEVPMTQNGATRYRGEIGPLPRGKYAATLMVTAADIKQVLARREFASAGAIPADAAELRLRPPNLALLRNLAQATGGGFDPSAATLTRGRGRAITVRRSADSLLLPLAIALFLGEVFVRRRFLGD
ncbi:MAG TPA: VWA domain-containing protein [Candidatus Binataceae bacterium]|nr:VWA domain-containing protein [Candidatus Binataceae bacterium]